MPNWIADEVEVEQLIQEVKRQVDVAAATASDRQLTNVSLELSLVVQDDLRCAGGDVSWALGVARKVDGSRNWPWSAAGLPASRSDANTVKLNFTLTSWGICRGAAVCTTDRLGTGFTTADMRWAAGACSWTPNSGGCANKPRP